MDKLHHDWLTEGLIDYEYKKYVLLAYLKDVAGRFDDRQLYPFLSDLIFHYRNLKRVQEKKEVMYESFPSSLSKADFKKLKLVYKKLITDDELVKCMEEIIHYALPRFKHLIAEGQALYEYVEDQLSFEPVGLVPIYRDEGYLLLHAVQQDIEVYRYQMRLFEGPDEKFKGISTTYLGSETCSFRSYPQIKIQLINKYRDLPNPATYLVVMKKALPMSETVLPVAKRLLINSLAA